MARTSASVHYNSVMTDVAVNFTPPDLVWDQVFLRKAVEKESDVYPVFDKDMFDTPNDLRSDGAESNETDIGWKYEPYQCEEHALHDVITKRMRDNTDSEIDLEMAVTEDLKQKVWNNIEKSAFSSTGILRTAANNGYSNNCSWATLSTASPRTDVQVAIEAVEANSGMSPNTIVLSREVGRLITRTAEYRDEAKYTVDIRNQDLPTELYGLKCVYVGALLNTAAKGVAKSISRVMADDVWIGYIDPAGLGYRRVTYGACLFTEEYVDSWYEKNRRSDIYEYGMIYQLKLIAKECGALLTSVKT